MQTLQDLGQAVAARRKLLGLRQGDVAAQAGVMPKSIWRFERGRGANSARASCWRCRAQSWTSWPRAREVIWTSCAASGRSLPC